jgi:hypothetical protein
MRKVAVGLLAAACIALAVPAHAQGFWFGVGPVGVGFGTGPYAYDYGPYRGGSYTYAPGYAYGYGYAPGYTYAPTYPVDYGGGPPYEYSYPPEYAYGTTYAAPAYVPSPYSYEPGYGYGRSFVGVRTSHPVASRHLEYRSARISGEAYRAQASAPVRHVNRHSQSVMIQR